MVSPGRFPRLPWQVRSRQVWLALWWESSASIRAKGYSFINQPSQLDRVFNATLSYRSDSWVDTKFYPRGDLDKKWIPVVKHFVDSTFLPTLFQTF